MIQHFNTGQGVNRHFWGAFIIPQIQVNNTNKSSARNRSPTIVAFNLWELLYCPCPSSLRYYTNKIEVFCVSSVLEQVFIMDISSFPEGKNVKLI